MENQIIHLVELPNRVKEFCALPNGLQKALQYKRNSYDNKTFELSSIKIEDGSIYYISKLMRVVKRPHNVYYLTSKGKGKGFTVDAKGKLTLWWGKTLNEFTKHEIDLILNTLGLTWFVEQDYLRPLMTPAIFGKILTGKVANPTEFAVAVLKAQRIKDVAPKLLLIFAKMVNRQAFLNSAYFIKLTLRYTTNFNGFVERLVNYHDENRQLHNDNLKNTSVTYETSSRYKLLGKLEEDGVTATMLIDIYQQADMLSKKVNLLWSGKRMQQVHTDWSEELLSYEVDSLEDVQATYKYLGLFSDFEDHYTTIVDTLKKAYAEGSSMKHCFYTNYWHKVKAGNYLTYHTTYGGIHGTLSIALYHQQGNVRFIIDQFYGIRNTHIPDEVRSYYEDKLNKVNNKIEAEEITKLERELERDLIF